MHNISPKTLFIGKDFVCLPMCHSTNEYAEKLIQENAYFEGTTIVTLNQTKGKGQRGNVWISPEGLNLTFSVILKPSFLSIDKQFYLNIFISLSVKKVLDKHGSGFKVKWPNDIYWLDYKIGGILIENKIKNSSAELSTIGIGINVNQVEFGSLNASSLKIATNKSFDLQSLLEELLSSMESYYLRLKAGDFNWLYKGYLENLYWINESRIFKGESYFKGEITGIDSNGRLEIVVDNDIKYFDIKEIQFIE